MAIEALDGAAVSRLGSTPPERDDDILGGASSLLRGRSWRRRRRWARRRRWNVQLVKDVWSLSHEHDSSKHTDGDGEVETRTETERFHGLENAPPE